MIPVRPSFSMTSQPVMMHRNRPMQGISILPMSPVDHVQFNGISTPKKPVVVIAGNAFKGTLSADEFNNAVADGLKDNCTIVKIPMADGGDGSLSVLESACPQDFQKIKLTQLCGPLPGMQIHADVLLNSQKTEAYIEASAIHGLRLLPGGKPTPKTGMTATSYGVGEAIGRLHHQFPTVQTVHVFLGGSASTDGGLDCLRALGYRFLDKSGQEVKPVNPTSMERIHSVQKPPAHPSFPTVIPVVDVKAPYLKAMTFATQKGIEAGEQPGIAENLKRIAHLLNSEQPDWIEAGGAGAAGGLGGAIMQAFGTSAVYGGDHIAAQLGLEQAIGKADLVITGEGRLDKTSLQGKAPFVVMKLAAKHHKPVVAIGGKVDLKPEDIQTALGRDAHVLMLPLYPHDHPLTASDLTQDASHHQIASRLQENMEQIQTLLSSDRPAHKAE